MRSNKAIAVSGCLVNQSLMATGCEAAPAIIRPVIEWALENDIGLIPWTCPETMFAGLPRATRGIERYRKDGLQKVCEKISAPFAEYLQRQIDGGIDVIAIVGVSFSPACSARRQAYHANEPGLFIQKLTRYMGAVYPVVIDLNRKQPVSITRTLDMLLR